MINRHGTGYHKQISTWNSIEGQGLTLGTVVLESLYASMYLSTSDWSKKNFPAWRGVDAVLPDECLRTSWKSASMLKVSEGTWKGIEERNKMNHYRQMKLTYFLSASILEVSSLQYSTVSLIKIKANGLWLSNIIKNQLCFHANMLIHWLPWCLQNVSKML